MIKVVLVGGPRDGRTFTDPCMAIPNIIRTQVVRTELPKTMTITDIAEIKAGANLANPEIVIDPDDIGLAIYEYREYDEAMQAHLYRWTGKIVVE